MGEKLGVLWEKESRELTRKQSEETLVTKGKVLYHVLLDGSEYPYPLWDIRFFNSEEEARLYVDQTYGQRKARRLGLIKIVKCKIEEIMTA